MHRRTFLTMTGVSAGTTSLLAGCSAIIGNQEPEFSYEAITGTWTASTYPEDSDQFVHSHAKLEIVKEGADWGEEVGTLTLFVEKGGEVHCESTLTAHDSDPPTKFWLAVEGKDYPCEVHIAYRFERATSNKLEWYIIYSEDRSDRVVDLSRANGREDATPTTRD